MSVRKHAQIATDAERRAARAFAAGEYARAADLFGIAAQAHSQAARGYTRWAIALACLSLIFAVWSVLGMLS